MKNYVCVNHRTMCSVCCANCQRIWFVFLQPRNTTLKLILLCAQVFAYFIDLKWSIQFPILIFSCLPLLAQQIHKYDIQVCTYALFITLTLRHFGRYWVAFLVNISWFATHELQLDVFFIPSAPGSQPYHQEHSLVETNQ